MKRILCLLLLLSAICLGQIRPELPTFLQGTSDPGKCVGLTFVWREDTHVLKLCYDTTLITLPTTSAGTSWCKYNVAFNSTNFRVTACDGTTSDVARAAALTQSVTLAALPAKSFVQSTVVKTSTAFVGTATLNITLGITGTTDLFVNTPFDVKTVVSATNLVQGGLLTGGGDLNNITTMAATNLLLTFTATTNNLSLISAGSIDVWANVTTLP